jgi:hypothetical protein
LPIASIIGYKLLNLTHAADLNYFLESPYSTWNVLSDKLNFDHLISTRANNSLPEEISLLISFKALIFCPLIIFAIYMFRQSTYQLLTLITPFALIEFLHIKYDNVYLAYEYYLMFLILALLCVIFKAQTIRRIRTLKIILVILIPIQIYTGYLFLDKSMISEEKDFITMLTTRAPSDAQRDNRDLASYINSIPPTSRVLVDDAIAYPIVAYVNNIKQLTMPYQDEFASAIESPAKYDDFILVATAKNVATGYTQLNDKYIAIIRQGNGSLYLRRVFETDDWLLYQISAR